ncbi:hypothetical protein GCM10009549_00750 [Streptomyces thermoalcalitolerans]|uniref:Uncharacterized protein n=1 Tax=Streptomyces thermoalcalitolerans TaxID=65605 RepID=A0ABN1NCB5_9ACTN
MQSKRHGGRHGGEGGTGPGAVRAGGPGGARGALGAAWCARSDEWTGRGACCLRLRRRGESDSFLKQMPHRTDSGRRVRRACARGEDMWCPPGPGATAPERRGAARKRHGPAGR